MPGGQRAQARGGRSRRGFDGGALRARGLALLAKRVKGASIRSRPPRPAHRARPRRAVVVGRVLDDSEGPAVGSWPWLRPRSAAGTSSIARREGEVVGSRPGEPQRNDAAGGAGPARSAGRAGARGRGARRLPLELQLGAEVPLVLAPAEDLPGAVAIEIAGARYVAPLGPARLGIGAWRLEAAGAGKTGSSS